jgi:hypothetical protein
MWRWMQHGCYHVSTMIGRACSDVLYIHDRAICHVDCVQWRHTACNGMWDAECTVSAVSYDRL